MADFFDRNIKQEDSDIYFKRPLHEKIEAFIILMAFVHLGEKS